MKKFLLSLTITFAATIALNAQNPLVINGTVSNNAGNKVAIQFVINPNSTSPIIINDTTDTSGYFYDSLSISTSSGTIEGYIIDCNNDTITQRKQFANTPAGRSIVT